MGKSGHEVLHLHQDNIRFHKEGPSIIRLDDARYCVEDVDACDGDGAPFDVELVSTMEPAVGEGTFAAVAFAVEGNVASERGEEWAEEKLVD